MYTAEIDLTVRHTAEIDLAVFCTPHRLSPQSDAYGGDFNLPPSPPSPTKVDCNAVWRDGQPEASNVAN